MLNANAGFRFCAQNKEGSYEAQHRYQNQEMSFLHGVYSPEADDLSLLDVGPFSLGHFNAE
jgi:hypothetical protein